MRRHSPRSPRLDLSIFSYSRRRVDGEVQSMTVAGTNRYGFSSDAVVSVGSGSEWTMLDWLAILCFPSSSWSDKSPSSWRDDGPKDGDLYDRSTGDAVTDETARGRAAVDETPPIRGAWAGAV